MTNNNKNEREEMKAILRASAELARSKRDNICPDDETLAAFAEGKLSGDESIRVRQHSMFCKDCLDVLLASTVRPERGVMVPGKALGKVIALDPITASGIELWNIVMSFKGKAIKVLRNTGDKTLYFGPEKVPVRGANSGVGDLVAFTKKYDGFNAEVEIERVGARSGDIKICINQPHASNNNVNGFRVTLMKARKELESYVPDNEGAAVLFENVNFGKYSINISKKGKLVGAISLDMKGDA